MTFDYAYNFFINSGFSESESAALAEIAIENEKSERSLFDTFYEVGVKVYGFTPEKASKSAYKFIDVVKERR